MKCSDIYPFLGIRHSLLIHHWSDGRNKTTIALHKIFYSSYLYVTIKNKIGNKKLQINTHTWMFLPNTTGMK